jgi:predicted molibdopterin-dependent oxidoreductase YjgC
VKKQLEITLDGVKIEAAEGENLVAVAQRAGVDIPTLCHDTRLDPMGSCRMCLVEIEGQRRLQPACAFPIEAGMEVRTKSERVQKHRELLLAMYLADHPLDEMGLPEKRGTGDELRSHALTYGVRSRFVACESPREGRVDINPYIQFDPEACIACARCVRYCDEVEAVSAIALLGRGAAVTIGTVDQVSLMDSSCELCGGCIDTCPTGAMFEKKAPAVAPESIEKVRSTCNFCGVGCQLDLNVSGDRVVKVTSPPPGETLNDGNLCVKGRFAYDFIHHEERLSEPLVRGADGQLHPATWEEAIAAAAAGLLGVKERHGADALGFISSSRCTGEENYLVQKLSRAAFGTNNCHQCAAT